MKILAIGALCAAFLIPISPEAKAQAGAPGTTLETATSGYDELRQASDLFYALSAPEYQGTNWANLPVPEQFRLKRLAVARYAPALQMTRRALAKGLNFPDDPNYGAVNVVGSLIEQFSLEAEVRFDDGDAMGAAQSSLDALDLAMQSRASSFRFLFDVSSDAGSLARVSLARYALALSATQSREVAAQLESIAARRPTLAEALRADQLRWAREVETAIADPTKSATISVKTKTQFGSSTTYITQLLTPDKRFKQSVTVDEFRANNALLYYKALEQAGKPYQSSKSDLPLRGDDAYCKVKAQQLNLLPLHFIYEREALADRLSIAALKLRALKLETGAYPPTYDAGADPFSPVSAPMIYRRFNDLYQLYSVGPDGVDDGGGALALTALSETDAIAAINESKGSGDIVAPVL